MHGALVADHNTTHWAAGRPQMHPTHLSRVRDCPSRCIYCGAHQPPEGPPGVGEARDKNADNDEDADADIGGDVGARGAMEEDGQQRGHDHLGRQHLDAAGNKQGLRMQPRAAAQSLLALRQVRDRCLSASRRSAARALVRHSHHNKHP